MRREAVLSSQIEGTESSLSDLLLFELYEAPGLPFDDVVEVSSYVAALEHGVEHLREGFPLSNRLIREMPRPTYNPPSIDPRGFPVTRVSVRATVVRSVPAS